MQRHPPRTAQQPLGLEHRPLWVQALRIRQQCVRLLAPPTLCGTVGGVPHSGLASHDRCKKYIVDTAKGFKKAKQWAAARDYAAGMLPIAQDMVQFDCPGDCKARDGAIGALTALRDEADSKL